MLTSLDCLQQAYVKKSKKLMNIVNIDEKIFISSERLDNFLESQKPTSIFRVKPSPAPNWVRTEHLPV